MRRTVLALFLVSLLASPALAKDLVTTWKAQDGGILRLSYRDDAHVRLDTGPESYMLVSGKKVYAVQKDEGQWTALDMDQVAGMQKMFGKAPAAPAAGKAAFRKTGRAETVAGYAGQVYEVESAGEGRDEVVLCADADVVRAGRGWAAVAARMSQVLGAGAVQGVQDAAAQAETSGGMLRYGRDLVLVSLEKSSLSDAFYALPEGAAALDVDAARAGEGESGGVGQDAKDVGDAARDEAKQGVIDGVRQGVGGVVRGLFGN
ncbi:MAG: hypothetical protein AB1916_07470 [Thermodesulfobacteriota bacterium]